MKYRFLSLIGWYIFVISNTCVLSINSANASATGYYDEQNDWVVIKWYSEDMKEERTSIIDFNGKIAPSVSSEILYKENEGFIYNYTVSNDNSAKLTIGHIYLKAKTKITNAHTPTPTTKYPWSSMQYRDTNTWSWFSSVDGASPGGSLSGFSATSKGLPAIIDIRFFGRRRVESTTPSYNYEPDSVTDAFFDEYERLEKLYPEKTKKYQELKTVGPTAPPEELNATDFMQGIIDMKHQAQELGWIKEEGGAGLIKALDKKLDNALKAIKKGDTGSAKNILEAFIQQVEAQGCETYSACPKGKHLMPEAYALLKFNAQYLIDNM